LILKRYEPRLELIRLVGALGTGPKCTKLNYFSIDEQYTKWQAQEQKLANTG